MHSFGADVIFTYEGLWVSDGSVKGTINIAPNVYGNDFTNFGSKVLFEGNTSGANFALWITDGTAAGTTEIGGPGNAGIVGADHEAMAPGGFTLLGDKAVFTA